MKKNNSVTNLKNVKCLIFDVDNTLAFPLTQEFYNRFGVFIYQYIKEIFQLSELDLEKLSMFYALKNCYLESILVEKLKNIPLIFSSLSITEFVINEIKFKNAYIELRKLSLNQSPIGYFTRNEESIETIKYFQSLNMHLICLTNAPEENSRLILDMTGLCPDNDFHIYHPWKANHLAPPKILKRSSIFLDLIEEAGYLPNQVISVGDSYSCDIAPAQEAGLLTCHISKDFKDTNLTIDSVFKLKTVFESWY
jgi:FMN phosphatase YigB (HAD superfamily)